MAQYMAQLNQVYAKMLQEMTLNMYVAGPAAAVMPTAGATAATQVSESETTPEA